MHEISNLQRAILEEAKQLAKDTYDDHIPFAMSVLYYRLRDSGDKQAANMAFQLLEKIEQEVYDSFR